MTAQEIFKNFNFKGGGDDVMRQIRALTDAPYFEKLKNAVLDFFKSYEGMDEDTINFGAWFYLDDYLIKRGFHPTDEYKYYEYTVDFGSQIVEKCHNLDEVTRSLIKLHFNPENLKKTGENEWYIVREDNWNVTATIIKYQ